MYGKDKEEKFIKYFDKLTRWPIDGCPLLEIKMPDAIHNEWLQWAEKYKEYKDHELGFLKEHLNKGKNSYQISVHSSDLEKSWNYSFIIRLGEYYIHKLKGFNYQTLRRCVGIRGSIGEQDVHDFWINYAYKGDSNPKHEHAGNIASVQYIKNVQDNPTYLLWEEKQINYEAEDGYMIMFPNNMTHWVDEKITEEERITGSVNLVFEEDWYNRRDKPDYSLKNIGIKK